MGFYDDLKFGQDAEKLLTMQYKFLEQTDGRKGDLRIKGTYVTIEKKADSYDPAKYPNIIIERYSMEEKPGGPWQADKNGCRYFLYQFVSAGLIFVFDVVQLLARMKKLIKSEQLRLHEKHNKNYVTKYYKVPIDMLKDIDLGMERLEREYKNAAKKIDKAKKAKKAKKG